MNPRYYRDVSESSELAPVERAAGTGRRVRASESKRSDAKARPRRLRPKHLVVGAVVAVAAIAVVSVASATVLRDDDGSTPSASETSSDPASDGTRPTSDATDDPDANPGSGANGASDDPDGSESLAGTWSINGSEFEFTQAGDQYEMTGVIEDTSGLACPEDAGRTQATFSETAPSTYEGTTTGALDLDDCTIDPAYVINLQIIVDGDTGTLTSLGDTAGAGSAGQTSPMTRVD